MAMSCITRGHQVCIVCGSYDGADSGLSMNFTKGSRQGMVNGIEVVELDVPYSNKQSFFSRIMTFLTFTINSMKIAFFKDYDLVVCSSTPLTIGLPGMVGKIFRKKPFVFEIRDPWPELPIEMGIIKNPLLKFLLRRLEWLIYQSADHCIGLSPGMVDAFVAQGVPLGKISMIPNGSDLDLFQSSSKATNDFPEIGDSSKCRFVYSGAHGQCNGLDALLDAAEVLLRRKVKNIQICLIGDGKLKESLIEKSKLKKLDEIIVWHDPVPKNIFSNILPSFDVGLMILANFPIYYYGTSPNKYFDYISAGLPVLNNYPGWLADIIKENGNGMAVKPEKPEVLAEAMIWFSENHGEKDSMGSKSRALAESKFSRRYLARKFVFTIEKANRYSTLSSNC